MNLRETSSKLRDLVFRWSETRTAWFRDLGFCLGKGLGDLGGLGFRAFRV